MDSDLQRLRQLFSQGWQIIDIEDHAGGKKVIRLRSDNHENETENLITTDPETIEEAFEKFRD